MGMEDKGSSSAGKRLGKAEATFMILFPIVLMISIGAFSNNLTNSGISATPNLTCDSTGVCTSTVNQGCQSNPSQCSFNGATISFLSQTSPFTSLLHGDIGAVFNQITSGSSSTTGHGAFDSVGNNNNLILLNCQVNGGSSTSIGHVSAWIISACTQANPDGSNMTKAQATQWSNWNTNFIGNGVALTFPVYHLNQNNLTGHGFLCQFQQFVNYTFSGSTFAGWDWYGCDAWTLPALGGCVSTAPASLTCVKNQYYYSLLIAVSVKYGGLQPTGSYTCYSTSHCWNVHVQAQLEPWETFSCYSTQPSLGNTRSVYPYLVSTQCDGWTQNLIAQANSGGSNFGVFTPIITFIMGVAFFILGFGVGMQGGGQVLGTGSNFGVFSNPQGTKMAQVIGGGLIIWSVIYSEFGGWIVPVNLPYGLDVIVFFVISGSFFFGLYERF